MKHYLYRSDAKIDLLFEQVERPAKETATLEWTVNLPGFKLTSKSERESEHTRTEKMEAVIKALVDRQMVGTIDKPREYFAGRCLMRWGTLRDWGRPEAESPLIYFGGRTEKTIFGLGGSSKHIIGNQGCASTDSRSSAPSIIGEILRGMDVPETGWRTAVRIDDDDTYSTFDAVKWANVNLTWAFEQELEFCAKTLAHGPFRDGDDKRILGLLGSPIYVSLSKAAMDFSYLRGDAAG